MLSATCVNGVHGYLLWSQKHERKWSISTHAARDKQTYLLYVTGHVLGGLFFLLFAYKFFILYHHVYGLFYLVLATYFFEIVQAVLPSKGAYELSHTVSALAMWGLFLLTGAISIFAVPQATLSRVVAGLIYIPLITMLVYSFFNRSRLYFYQMCMVLLFYASVTVIVIGS